MKINNFALIIGAMKCGTSSLFSYLAQHPEVSACNQKEPNFFCKSYNYSQGFEYYKSLWDWNHTTHKVALEATPNYTKFTDSKYLNAAENIAKIIEHTNAQFKFIYIMRDPIDRIESHYTHALKRKKTAEKIEKILTDGLDDNIVDASRYAMQLEEYYRRFPSDDILLLNFEDLKNNPLDVVKKVCIFLNIDSEYQFQGLNIVHNVQSKKINFPGWYTIRHTKPICKIIKQVSPQKRQALRNIFEAERNDYIKLSSKQKKSVANTLHKDIQKLSLEYGFDVSCWKSNSLYEY